MVLGSKHSGCRAKVLNYSPLLCVLGHNIKLIFYWGSWFKKIEIQCLWISDSIRHLSFPLSVIYFLLKILILLPRSKVTSLVKAFWHPKGSWWHQSPSITTYHIIFFVSSTGLKSESSLFICQWWWKTGFYPALSPRDSHTSSSNLYLWRQLWMLRLIKLKSLVRI